MKKAIFVLTILSALTFNADSFAQCRAPRVSHRQMHQHERIQQGRRHGELTRHETRHLRTQQMIIKHDKRMAMADGRVTPRERQIINREQNNADRSIYRMKHNNRHR